MKQEQVLSLNELVKQSIEDLERQKNGDIYFLIVYINDYLYERNLSYCEEEASEFKHIFERHTDLKKNNVYTLADQNATKYNIVAHLNQFQRILDKDDRLIIYFSGHGNYTDVANFFIPYDGRSDNWPSCITTQYIANSLTRLRSEHVLLFFDCCLSINQYKTYTERLGNLSYMGSNQLAMTSGTSSLYHNFLSFFSKTAMNRVRESYCFTKQHSQERLYRWPASIVSHNELKIELHKHYQLWLSLIDRKQTENVLKLLYQVLLNNDSDLLSRVETCQSTLRKIKSSKTDLTDENKKDITLIDKITCDVIERINQNGFYLIQASVTKSRRPRKRKEKIKIVFTSANPRDQDFLRLKEEEEFIEFELMRSKHRDKFLFIKARGIGIEELQDLLLNESPHFLHFSGHGSCDGVALLNDDENTQLARTKPFAQLLGMFSSNLQCVFLNSCHSIRQSMEICKHIKKVVL